MDCKVLNFFTWPLFSICFNKWVSVNTLTDKIFIESKILDHPFHKMSENSLELLIRTIRKCDKAPKYREHILMQFSYTHYKPNADDEVHYKSLDHPPNLDNDSEQNLQDDFLLDLPDNQ